MRPNLVFYFLILGAAIGVPQMAFAQEAFSILRGSLADRLAQSAGDTPGGNDGIGDPAEALPDGAASLTEENIEDAEDDENDIADEDEDEDDIGEDDDGNAAEAAEDAADDVADVGDDDDDETVGNELNDYEALFSLRSGYASNYDELVEARSSPFVELSAALEVERSFGKTDVFGSLSATVLELTELDIDKRFFADASLGLRRELTDEWTVDGAVALAVDGFDLPVTLERAAAVGLQYGGERFAAGMRLSYAAEEAIVDRLEDGIDASYDDYYRFSGETTLIARPKASVAPIVTLRGSRIVFPTGTYFDDDDDVAAIDRDAYDGSVAAGLRLKPIDGVTITIAARANGRTFDAPDVPNLYTFFPDLQAVIEPMDDWTLAASVTSIIDEPDSRGSYAQKVRTYAASIAYAPDRGLGAELTGGFSQFSEYGVRARSEEAFVGGVVRYRVNENFAAALDVTQTWTNDITFGDDTQNTEVAGSVSLDF